MKKIIILPLIFSLSLIMILSSCEAQKVKKHKKKDKKEQTNTISQTKNKNDTGSMDCDAGFWKYVYNPDRLKVIDKCKTVTGVIEESSADEDGDQHMLLKLDDGQENLLTDRNIKKKEGYLVIEAVCANNTSLKKVGSTCNGYINKIQIPKVGDHVKVTGSLVIDSHNGWAEIHPITKMEMSK